MPNYQTHDTQVFYGLEITFNDNELVHLHITAKEIQNLLGETYRSFIETKKSKLFVMIWKDSHSNADIQGKFENIKEHLNEKLLQQTPQPAVFPQTTCAFFGKPFALPLRKPALSHESRLPSAANIVNANQQAYIELNLRQNNFVIKAVNQLLNPNTLAKIKRYIEMEVSLLYRKKAIVKEVQVQKNPTQERTCSIILDNGFKQEVVIPEVISALIKKALSTLSITDKSNVFKVKITADETAEKKDETSIGNVVSTKKVDVIVTYNPSKFPNIMEVEIINPSCKLTAKEFKEAYNKILALFSKLFRKPISIVYDSTGGTVRYDIYSEGQLMVLANRLGGIPEVNRFEFKENPQLEYTQADHALRAQLANEPSPAQALRF